MTLRLRFESAIDGTLIADTFAGDAKIEIGLDQSGSFSASLASNQRAVSEIEQGNLVKIFWNGALFMDGVVRSFDRKFDDTTKLNIKGTDTLDELFRYRANSTGGWREELNVLMMIAELLDDAGWRLGDISTFFDTAAVRKVDVRDTDRMMEQINKLLATTPDTHFRYGGLEAGYRQLDVGSFQRDSFISLLTAAGDPIILDNSDMVGEIVDFSENTTLEDIYLACEVVGGTYTNSGGNEKTIFLGDAWDKDSDIVHDSEYPLRETVGPFRWTVYNKELAGFPGGQVGAHVGRVPPNGSTGVLQVGETISAAVDYTGVLLKFTPVPGVLREILIWSHDGAANWPMTDGANVRASLVEVEELTPGANDWRPTVALPIAEVDFLPNITGAEADGIAVTSITFDEEITLSWDKNYGIVLQPTTTVTGDRKYWSILSDSRVPTRTISAQEIDLINTLPRIDMTDLGSFTLRETPMVIIITDPVGITTYESITKRWSDYAPESDDSSAPTAGEIDDAAFSAYKHTTAFLADHAASLTGYTLAAVGENIIPNAGDTVYVRGQAEGAYVDPFTSTAEIFRTLIEADLIVDTVNIDFRQDRLNIKYGLRNGAGKVQ